MEDMQPNEKMKEQNKGESYSRSDQELIRELVKSRKAQNSALEYEDLSGYELPPRTQFSMLNKPAVSIKYGKMTFNMACIRLFEDIEHILTLVHRGKKKLTIVPCSEEESASVQWARQKEGTWKNKQITSEEFVEKLFRLMEWDRNCRYKVMGKIANSSQGLVLVFELEEAIMFAAKPVEFVDQETGVVKKKQIKYYPDEYKDRIGKSYDDYLAVRQINLFEYLEEYTGKTYSDLPDEKETDGQDNEKVDTEASLTESQVEQGYSNTTSDMHTDTAPMVIAGGGVTNGNE